MWRHIGTLKNPSPMKSLFFTLLILGGAFLAYDYFVAEPGTKIVFKSLNPPPKPKVVTAPPADDKPAGPARAPAPAPEPVKPVVTAPPPPAPTTPEPPKSTAPKFDSIEMLTANWLNIPATAFPREVRVLQDVEFKMSVGSSKVAAGAKAYALGASQGILTLAPTATSPARAQAPIDATDLKPQLTALYENWKVLRAKDLLAIAATKRQQQADAPAGSEAPSAGSVEPGGKPVRASDGTFPLLIASMKSGQVTEITPSNIKGWQEAQPVKVQGKDGWGVKVNFDAKTVFGPQPAEAQAIVLNGKVTGWYFTGSGEEVP